MIKKHISLSIILGLALIGMLILAYDWRLNLMYLSALGMLALLVKQKKPSPLVLFLFFIALLITTVLFLFLPNIQHNKTTGVYQVGVEQSELFDPTRERTLPIKVWFPLENLDSTSGKAPWVSAFEPVSSALAKVGGLPQFIFSHIENDTAGYNSSLLDTAIIDKPVVLLAHGRNGIKEFNTFMALELASHGYIVAAADHTKGSMVSVFENGSVIPFDRAEFGEEEFIEDAQIFAEKKLAAVQQVGQTWSTDLDVLHQALIKTIPQLKNQALIVGGHSTGGGAAIEFCHNNADCLGAIGLDPWLKPVSDVVLENGSNKPILNLYSDPIRKDMEAVNQERQARLADAMESNNIMLETHYLDKAGHVDFCDAALLSPYSYLFGQSKGKVNTRDVMAIINAESLEFIQTLTKQ